jgi:hypothetical protein
MGTVHSRGRWPPSCQRLRRMKTLRRIVAVSLVSAGALVAGCEHTDDRHAANSAPARATTRPTGVTNAQAGTSPVVNRLSDARCDREQACDNIGDGKKYASRRVCLDEMRGNIANDLNAYQCPGGIDEAAVRECQMAIRNEECGVHPFEAITRMDKCRSGPMCKK